MSISFPNFLGVGVRHQADVMGEVYHEGVDAAARVGERAVDAGREVGNNGINTVGRLGRHGIDVAANGGRSVWRVVVPVVAMGACFVLLGRMVSLALYVDKYVREHCLIAPDSMCMMMKTGAMALLIAGAFSVIQLVLASRHLDRAVENVYERPVPALEIHPPGARGGAVPAQVEEAPAPPRRIENPVISMSQKAWDTADISGFPPYPLALVEFLAGPCPIWEGKKASDTHIVVPLFPTITMSIDGSVVTVSRKLDTLHALAISSGLGFAWIAKGMLKPEFDRSAEAQFHWAVLTKDVFPNSKDQFYETQKKRVEAKGYKMPGFLDAATAMLWYSKVSGKRTFSADKLTYSESDTYTGCEERFEGYRVVVGGFCPSGLQISNHTGKPNFYNVHYWTHEIGVAGFRKF